MAIKEDVSLPSQRICSRCKFVSSQEVCKACVLLEGLNKGLPRLGIGKSSKAKKMLEEYNARQQQKDGSLQKAVHDLDDSTNINDKSNCLTGKSCRTGICKSKNEKQEINEDIVNNGTQCSSKNCCSGKCKSNQDTVNESNAKINSLLQQYGLDDSTHKESKTEDSNENGTVNANIDHVLDDSDSELLYNNQDEDNSCSGTCGKMGSLQIGF